MVAHDAILDHFQSVAQEGGPLQLAQEGLGELLESIREDDDLGERAQFAQERQPAVQRPERADHLLNVGELQTMLVEDLEPSAHELVVVRFLASGAAEFLEAGLLGDGDPDFRHQHPFQIQGHDRLFHGPGVFQDFRCLSRARSTPGCWGESAFAGDSFGEGQ